jgi:predicted amidohydrolase YtcJ
MYRAFIAMLSLAYCLLVSCQQQSDKSSPSTLYFNGDILTMEGDLPRYVEAIVEKDGILVFVGSLQEAEKVAGPGAIRIDLAGKCLVPGFVDPHGHLIYASKSMLDANLSGCTDIPELLDRLRQHMPHVPEGGWLVGMGYRTEQLKEGRHPTAAELDAVSATIPIFIKDGSGHHGSINTGMMQALQLGPETPDPENGFFERDPKTGALIGHVAEEASYVVVGGQRPAFTPELINRGIALACQTWVEHGHTTAMETGLGLGSDDFEMVQYIIDQKLMPIDLVLYVKGALVNSAIAASYNVAGKYAYDRHSSPQVLLSNRPDMNRRYYNRVRLAGLKFWMDGSNESALMSRPFTRLPAGISDKHYQGMLTTPIAVLDSAFERYWKDDRVQIAAHVIGDEAVEQFLNAVERAVERQGMTDHRPVFQHAQFTRPDQVGRIKAVGGIPSFTMGGMEMMGDGIAAMFGEERVNWSVPANSMETAGLRWTSHTDWPAGVSPSEILGVHCAVNRTTNSGQVVAPQERVTPYQAMRSITINAAYQIKEEKTKGSLVAGKLADLVILDRNPLKIAPSAIKHIQVLQTIKEGKSVFSRTDADRSTLGFLHPNKEPSCFHHHSASGPALSKADRDILAALLSDQ